MRKSSLCVFVLAVTAIVSPVSADDFDALLADLSFGNASSTESLGVAEIPPADELKPVPGRYEMPEMGVTSARRIVAKPTLVTEAPKIALQDPVPAASPSQAADLDAAFAADAPTGLSLPVPTQAAGHLFHSDECQECQTPFIPSGIGIACVPRQAPTLPSSTLRQYFRSNACHTHVWDGYRQDCGKHREHLNGTCDCFDKSKKKHCWFGSNSCECDNCASCDGR